MKTIHTAACLAVLLASACSRKDAPHGAAATRPADAPARVADAKPVMVPPGQRRILELEGGIRVEVLAEGQGAVVAPGDQVALSMTLSYVPVPPAPVVVKPGESGPAEAAKPADAGPKMVNGIVVLEGAVGASSAPEPAAAVAAAVEPAAGTKPEVPKGTEPEDPKSTEPLVPKGTEPQVPKGTEPAVPASTEPAAATVTEPAPTPASATTPPAEAPPLAAPLEPVILVSTKSAGTPIRAVVGSSGALLPGLSRALVGLRAGTIVEITLPPEAAYGAAGLPSAGVPPGTPLFATVEIREVKR